MAVDWCEGFGGWDSSTRTGGTLRPLLARRVGAIPVGPDARDTIWWHGGSSHAHDDVVSDRGNSDQVRTDVKRSWVHDVEAIGFGGPGKLGSFDPAAGDLIALVSLDAEDIAVELGSDPTGAVGLSARAVPQAVHHIPAASMNEIMRQDGRIVARWLVSFVAEKYRVRGRRPTTASAADAKQGR